MMPDESEFVKVVSVAKSDFVDAGRFFVVSIVERSHVTIELETVGVPDGMLVHFDPVLLSIVHEVQACGFKVSDREDRCQFAKSFLSFRCSWG